MDVLAISGPVVVTAQRTDLPGPVVEGVKRWWSSLGLHNNNCYTTFDVDYADDIYGGP